MGHLVEEKQADDVDAPEDQMAAPNHTASSNLSWEDYALAIGAGIMQTCRVRVLRELGYSCSAGIAHNKVSMRPQCEAIAYSTACLALLLTMYLNVPSFSFSICLLCGKCLKVLAKICSSYRKPNAQVSAK